MGLLDSVSDDPNPIVATIDFNDYAFGAKLSTKAREYFEAKKSAYGITGSTDQDLFFYLANVLFDRMKEEMKKEAKDAAMAAKLQAETAVFGGLAETEQEVDSLELVKI